jgi:transposase-like protein
MGRPPTIPPETKTRIVLAVLAGEVSITEAARKEKVSGCTHSRYRAWSQAHYLRAQQTRGPLLASVEPSRQWHSRPGTTHPSS